MVDQQPAPDEVKGVIPEREPAGIETRNPPGPARLDVEEHLEDEVRTNDEWRGFEPDDRGRPAAQIEHPVGFRIADAACHDPRLRRQGLGRDRVTERIRVFAPYFPIEVSYREVLRLHDPRG
jgi:hypothetical protein